MKVSDAINKRRTVKVLSDEPWPVSLEEVDGRMQGIIQAAEMAPFHYQAHKSHLENAKMDSIVPWRVYALQTEGCRAMAAYIKKYGIRAGKILQMLHAADFMLQVTWLPDPNEQSEEDLFEANLRNMEHIAAASAAIQNMLLAATAVNIPNYWSSGGVLRKDEFYKLMSICKKEILLGSLFFFPENTDTPDANRLVAFGGLREKKGTSEQWSRIVSL